MSRPSLPKVLSAPLVDYINNAGSGTKASHAVADGDNPYIAGRYEIIYAIQCYTDECVFSELEEDGDAVSDIRLDAGGAGYPAGAVITGSFTKVSPAAGGVVGLFILRSS